MKNLIIRIVVFLGCLLILMLGVFYSADGNADGLYLKFTTPEQSSMILGTSKAAQGLQPAVINRVLGRSDMYNYSFTVIHSPYGPAYLKSIKRKLKKSTSNGIFIITVDPHSIASRTENPNDSLNFRENNSAVGQIDNVTTFPNFDYLIFHYPEQYIYLLTRKIKYVNQGVLHHDGWVETNLPMDPGSVEKRTAEKIVNYKNEIEGYKFSEVRLDYLEKTIELLKNHGDVYLLRLPAVTPILELEDSIVPDFDQKMKNIAEKHNLNYLNFALKAEDYTYDDGNHLDKKSGEMLSKEVAEWIKSVD